MTILRSPRLLLALLLWLAAALTALGAPLRLTDLLFHALAAGALSVLILDVAQRFRARGLYGTIALAGLYGLAAVTLFEPPTGANDLPRLLVTRGLGAHTLMGLLMLTVWFAVLRGRDLSNAAVASAAAGLLALMWARSLPSTEMLVAAAVLTVLSVAAAVWTRRSDAPPYVLSWRGQGAAALVLVALIAYRFATGALDGLTLAIALGLLAFVGALIWFQRSKRGVSLLDAVSPPAPLRPRALILPAALVVGAVAGAALAPNASLRDGLDAVVTAFGIVWLPAMSFAIGARALLRQVSAEQL